MATLSYDAVYSSFLSNVTDYKLASQDDETTDEVMKETLHKAVASPFISRILDELTMDDTEETITYTLKHSTTDDRDNDYLTKVLGKQMVCEWLTPQLNSTTMLAQMFAGKEQKFYSQAAHITEMRNVVENATREVKILITDRTSYMNSYTEAET